MLVPLYASWFSGSYTFLLSFYRRVFYDVEFFHDVVKVQCRTTPCGSS